MARGLFGRGGQASHLSILPTTLQTAQHGLPRSAVSMPTSPLLQHVFPERNSTVAEKNMEQMNLLQNGTNDVAGMTSKRRATHASLKQLIKTVLILTVALVFILGLLEAGAKAEENGKLIEDSIEEVAAVEDYVGSWGRRWTEGQSRPAVVQDDSKGFGVSAGSDLKAGPDAETSPASRPTRSRDRYGLQPRPPRLARPIRGDRNLDGSPLRPATADSVKGSVPGVEIDHKDAPLPLVLDANTPSNPRLEAVIKPGLTRLNPGRTSLEEEVRGHALDGLE